MLKKIIEHLLRYKVLFIIFWFLAVVLLVGIENIMLFSFEIMLSSLNLILFLYTLKMWLVAKESREKIVMKKEFRPPESLNPVEVGYISNKSLTRKDMTTLVIYWAQKGYLKIREESLIKETFAEKFKNVGKEVQYFLTKNIFFNEDKKLENDYERSMFKRLFSYGEKDKKGNKVVKVSVLADEFYKTLKRIKPMIKNKIKGSKSRIDEDDQSPNIEIYDEIFLKSKEAIYYGVGFLFLLSLLKVITSNTMDFDKIFMIIFMLAQSLVCFTYGLNKIIKFINNTHMDIEEDLGLGFILFFISFLSLFLFYKLVMIYEAYSFLSLFFIFIIIINVIIVVLLLDSFKLTAKGIKLVGQIEGFKEFLINPKEEILINQKSDYFYDILPYAINLRLSSKWVNNFHDFIEDEPSWYISDKIVLYDSNNYSEELLRSLNSIRSTMKYIRRSNK